jgi:DNA primase catalytic core
MARIPQDEVERLKREVSVERLASAAGVELERHGADLVGRCPFHEDKTPSLVVTPSKNLWHCMGACQQGGSVIDWVMKAEGVSFRHAVELLRSDVPVGLTKPVKTSTVRKLAPPMAPDGDDRAALLQVVGYYHEQLKQSPEALGYLEKRGLHSSEMVERFRLGFANRTLGYRLPQKNRKEGAELRGRLMRLGILRESGHEHFAGSLVIPIFGDEGEALGMYGRKITPGLRPGTPLHLYLPGPHRGVWNAEALQASKTVILCEALIDALTFWCAGYRYVTASYGVDGFTKDHLEAFQRHGTRTVLIAYDRDEAGERAAESLAAKLLAAGMDCYRVLFPRGMDANEYAQKVKPAEKSLGLVLRQAVWMGKGKKALDEELTVERPSATPAAPKREAPPEPEPEEIAEPTPSSPLAAEAAARAATAPTSTEPAAAEPPPSLAPPTQPPHSASPVGLATSPATAEVEPIEVTASPEAPAPRAVEVKADVSEEEVTIRLGDRRYRVRGLAKNMSYDALRVNLLVAKEDAAAALAGGGFHVDTVDLYSARQRAAFVKQAAHELGVTEEVVRRDLGKVLSKLEQLQEEQITRALEPKEKAVTVGDEERAAALELLRDPKLVERILQDFERCGVIGEEVNKLTGYLAATSRKLEEPLAVIIQSSSAAGKSSLMEAVLALMPEEERVKYSAMTGQSLFYMGETDLKQKILAIVEEEGASRASYALKLLQSEGELAIASTGKDPTTGRLVTHEYRVEGPVMIFLTTTAIELDEELLNRCLVLTVDEDREQTRAIHRLQRERQTLEGLLARRDRDAILALHRNAQRLLRPLLVANPYARELTFLDDRTRTRRDHMKYLSLIRTIALLHQYQREVKTVSHHGQPVEYVEVTLEDLALANLLAHEVLGRSLDELPPQTRRVLLVLDEMVAEACRGQGTLRSDYRFTRRALRERMGLGNTQAKVHLGRLEELEYVVAHGAGRGVAYELVYDGQGKDGTPFLAGLIDLAKLGGHEYDGKWSALSAKWSGVKRPRPGSGRATGGPESVGSRGGPIAILESNGSEKSVAALANGRKAHLESLALPPSYVNGGLAVRP